MPDSQVVTVMREYKAALLRGEQAQMQEMARRWLAVERRLAGQMEALAWEMNAIKRDGGTVSRELLMNEQRYRELVVQLTQELEKYSENTAVQITAQQRRLARLGVAHAENAIRASGLRAGFNRLPTEAVEYMVGLSGSGSPLRQLLANSWPLSVDGLTQELVNGVALGYNPRKTARLMAQGTTGSLDRMMVIARTEQLRVYRQANRDSYRASGVVGSYKRLATHDDRVCAACLMDEGTVYDVGEEMPEHPQGRCAMVPVVDGVPNPTWKQGREWFEEQDVSTQKAILGKGRFYAWQNGDFDLGELVTVTPNATWGPSIGVTPLGKLGGAGQVAAAIPEPVRLQPSGPPVRDFLRGVPTKGALSGEFADALSAMESVHGVEPMREVSVKASGSLKTAGLYSYKTEGRQDIPLSISVKSDGSHPRLTFAHEVGHYLDQQGVGVSAFNKGRRLDVTLETAGNKVSEAIEEWRGAVRRSNAYTRIREATEATGPILYDGQVYPADKQLLKYMSKVDELWARSYAQYIATKSNNSDMLAELRSEREGFYGFRQWDDTDFAPIADAIDKILLAKGWIR